MTLAELVAAVTLEIGRPDLSARTTAAVKAAVLAAHNIDVFEPDLVVAPVIFASAVTTQAFLPRKLFPLFREVRDIQLMGLDGQAGIDVPKIDSGSMVDGYGYLLVPSYFRLGDRITVRAAAPIEAVRLVYRAFPDVADATFSSWIARDFPYYIVYKAAQHMLGPIMGKAEEAKMMDVMAREHLSGILSYIVRN